MTERRVAFIMSQGYSGSTLLALILGSHSSAFSLGELDKLLGIVNQERRDTPHNCATCLGPCQFWSKQVDWPYLGHYFSFSRRPLAYARRAQLRLQRSIYDSFFDWTQRSLLVDCSKSVSATRGPVWLKERLRFPYQWQTTQPYLLYVVRDGRAVVNSVRRAIPHRPLERVVANWIARTQLLQAAFDAFPAERRLRVSYEQLTLDPRAEVMRVCERLHVPFEESMLSYWQHPHHALGMNRGTRSLLVRYRTEQLAVGQHSAEHIQSVRKDVDTFYDNLGLSIRLDERWRRELPAADLAYFEQQAGPLNAPLMYEPALT